MIIIKDFEQGSPEWFAARCGIPTASGFDKIICKDKKGGWTQSKQREKYMYQLAGERITGVSTDSYSNEHMERGKILEEEARQFYELTRSVTVNQVGLCYKDDKKLFSCSPDGLVDDGGIEIKCPAIHNHISYMLDNNALVKDYFQQVQGSIYITGLKWWDIISYYPAMKPVVVRVLLDDSFIQQLAVELDLFCKNLDAITEKIK